MPRRRLPFSLALATACTLAAGLLVTALLFVAVSRLEYAKMTLNFQQRSNLRVAAVRQGLAEAVEVLTMTNQFFASVDPVTREQFRDFTAPLLLRYPYIQAFNFHRVVRQSERAAVEAELSRLVPGTVLREMRGAELVTAPQRERYQVVDYLEPMQGNLPALGLNVSQNGKLHDALDDALRRGRAAATGLLTLAQDASHPQSSFEVILPVYRRGASLATLAEREAALSGDTAILIRAQALISSTLVHADLLADKRVLLSVYASELPSPATLVYDNGNPASTRPLARGDDGPLWLGALGRWLSLDYREEYLKPLDIGGQTWLVRLDRPPRAFLLDHLGSLSTLLGGILSSLLMAAYVQTMVRRARRIQAMVADRTEDLQHANQRLSVDVATRKRAEQALFESEQRFRQLVSMSSDWYWEQDEQFRYTSITGGASQRTRTPETVMLGKTRWETAPQLLETEEGRAHIEQVKAHLPFSKLEYAITDKSGNTHWFQVNGEPIFDIDGAFRGYRGTGTNITARKHSEQHIYHIAHHDVLTGLPNRALLQDRLDQAIAWSTRSGHPIWVMLVDLDRFKFVNDSMGHKAGDLLLMTVAERLRSALRDTDTVARLSGDEFVAILTEHTEQHLSVDVVQRVMDSVARPVLLGSKEFFVTCSIGIAVYPTDGAPGQNLIEHADIAMYRAKKLGRNNFQFYTPAMNEEAAERLRIESALRSALEKREFVLHYQPQVDLASGRIVGMEALIRWQHPELGMVAPNRFIGLAEETGLIVPIGAWVMRAACLQNRAWQDAGLGRLRVAVNLSARQFASPQLLGEIESALAASGLTPADLEIELTESLFLTDVDQAVELLHSMKRLGVSLSIDDFGTGYSSLSYLRRFPIDVLKIDQSFVRDMGSGANAAPIVASIITLAHNLKLNVIAEGVETEAQLAYLRRHGCNEMQGYLFSRPLPAAEFEALLRTGKQLPVADAVLAP